MAWGFTAEGAESAETQKAAEEEFRKRMGIRRRCPNRTEVQNVRLLLLCGSLRLCS